MPAAKIATNSKALHETDLETVVGTINFNDENFGVTPLGGAQWQKDEVGNLVKENVFNEVYPEVKITAEMKLYAAIRLKETGVGPAPSDCDRP